jgi:hypothetical protein
MDLDSLFSRIATPILNTGTRKKTSYITQGTRSIPRGWSKEAFVAVVNRKAFTTKTWFSVTPVQVTRKMENDQKKLSRWCASIIKWVKNLVASSMISYTCNAKQSQLAHFTPLARSNNDSSFCWYQRGRRRVCVSMGASSLLYKRQNNQKRSGYQWPQTLCIT